MSIEIKTFTETELFQKSLEKWGKKLQYLLLFEELAELQVKLVQYERQRATMDQIAEEIADVQLMIKQIFFMWGTPSEWIESEYNRDWQRMQKWNLYHYLEYTGHFQREYAHVFHQFEQKEPNCFSCSYLRNHLVSILAFLDVFCVEKGILDNKRVWEQKKLFRLHQRLEGDKNE